MGFPQPLIAIIQVIYLLGYALDSRSPYMQYSCMEEYPKTVQEFEEKFASEQSCIDYLFRLRWPEGFRCPRCGYERFWAMNRGL